MLTNLSLMPHNSLIVIKDIVKKINYIDLMINLLKEFQRSLNYFENNKLNQFDAQVGETLCQIRAYKIYSLRVYSSPAFFSSLRELKNNLDSTIGRLELEANQYQQFLKMHKSERPEYIRTPITLIDLFSNLGCLISIPEDAIYIFVSYFLCQYHIVDSDNIPVTIDYKKIATHLSLSRSYSKKLGHFYQKLLSEQSCHFVFELLDQLPGKNELQRILPQLHLKSDEGRMVLPCYCVTEIIVLHMIKKSANLLLIVDVVIENSRERVTYYLKGSRDTNNFELTHHMNSKEPCVVMYGSHLTNNLLFKETLQAELLSFGIKETILSNNASHPQYSGETLKAFQYDPFQVLMAEKGNLLSQFDIFLIKKLSTELLKQKQAAEEMGCTANNQSLFLLKHVFCDIVNNYTEYSVPESPSVITNTAMNMDLVSEAI